MLSKEGTQQYVDSLNIEACLTFKAAAKKLGESD